MYIENKKYNKEKSNEDKNLKRKEITKKIKINKISNSRSCFIYFNLLTWNYITSFTLYGVISMM